MYTKKPKIRAPPGGGFTPKPIAPPRPASDFILEPPSTSCILQGLQNVPEELCHSACMLVANRTYTGEKKFTNVKGCFAIMDGQWMTNCNYNLDDSEVCTPPCGGSDEPNYGEICLTQSMMQKMDEAQHVLAV